MITILQELHEKVRFDVEIIFCIITRPILLNPFELAITYNVSVDSEKPGSSGK